MTVLKWIAIAAAGLGTLVLVSCVGAIGWVSSLESIKMTEADLVMGGDFPDAERAAMVTACKVMSKGAKSADDMCGCVADVSSTEMSRYERHVVTAVFEQSPGKIVSLIKGLTEAGVPAERIEELQGKSKEQQVEAAMARCATDTAASDAPEAAEETVSSEQKTAGEEAPAEENSEKSESDGEAPPEQSSDDQPASSEDSGESEAPAEPSDQ